MKTAIALGALLIATNAAWAVIHFRQPEQKYLELYADHVQRLQMNTPTETLRVYLGASSTRGGPIISDSTESGLLVLTPRAAIQLQVELTRTIRLVQEAAEVQTSKQSPPDRTL